MVRRGSLAPAMSVRFVPPEPDCSNVLLFLIERGGGTLMSNTVLLLNSSYAPLRVIPRNRAICLVVAKKAEIVSADDSEYVRSEHLTLKAPKVVRLLAFVKIPYRAMVALNRKSLMARDRGMCQYCGEHGNTIDHIVPRARGGRHEWTNVATACVPCNQKKGDRLLSELGWTLLNVPIVPRVNSHVLIGMGLVLDPEWDEYLAVV